MLLLFSFLCVCVSQESTISTGGRFDFVVSIPDIHGDLEALLRALWIANAEVSKNDDMRPFESFASDVGKELQKVAPTTLKESRVLLINTGDVVDRGPQSLSCYRVLEGTARMLNWTLVNLLGNHELMTLGGQADHYAHPNDIEEFGGIEARHAQFAPGGKMWSKITDNFLVMLKVQIGKQDATLFVHAGIDPVVWLESIRELGLDSVEAINKFLRAELKSNPYSEFLSGANSPLWTRDLALESEEKVCGDLLPSVFEFFKINRMIVGHTPQESLRTALRCGAKLLLADVAMSRWMGSGEFGNPSAIIFTLSEKGNSLDTIHNVYWNGSAVVRQTIEEVVEVENYEL